MKHKSRVGPAGLLLLVMLRQAHSRRVPIGIWQTHSWNKAIINASPNHAAGSSNKFEHAR